FTANPPLLTRIRRHYTRAAHRVAAIGKSNLCHGFQGAVIIAVAGVRMMQVPANEIVKMVPMGRHFMPALWSVSMPSIMPLAIMIRRARIRIGATHRYRMLIDVVIVDVMQVTVVKIISMAVVRYGLVTAAGVMRMTVTGVFLTRTFHKNQPPC